MPSPFPGMDPYLEGYLWPDVHHRLANKFAQKLAPRLRPRYVARLEIAVLSDEPDSDEVSIMYPDVEVLKLRRAEPEPTSPGAGTPVLSAPLVLPLMQLRVPSVEVREVASNELVAVIEVLSPVNKREPNLSRYQDKITDLHHAAVHILAIDLLRRGTRIHTDPRLRSATYLVTLTRALDYKLEAWPLSLQDQLPTVPVPLRPPDAAVPLDLSAALAEVYDEAAYDLSLDYHEPPPPPSLSPEDPRTEDLVLRSTRTSR